MKTYRLILTALLTMSLLASCNKENGDTPIKPTSEETVCGTIKYNDGTPAAGVAVTDGFTVVVTNEKGQYTFERNKKAMYVYLSLPADAKVETMAKTGTPFFYKMLQKDVQVYDFSLTRIAVEEKFRIIGIGDPQASNSTQIKYYSTETVPDMKSFVTKHNDMQTYGLTLGDMSTNVWDSFETMQATMDINKSGFPIFVTIGNHDHEFNSSIAASDDPDFESQRRYERIFGPVCYSINRGKVHIVSLDDIVHSGKASDQYGYGLTDDKWKWFQQDMALVPEDHLVVVFMHSPFNSTTTYHIPEIINMIGEHKGFFVAGHKHYHTWADHSSKSGNIVHEYILGTACGAFWDGRINTDGTPNGYGVFEFDGNRLVNQYYKSTRKDENFQMRMYRSNPNDAFTGKNNKHTAVKWMNPGEGKICVNVWNIYNDWKIALYEDGVKTAEVTTAGNTSAFDVWAKGWFNSVNSKDAYMNSHKHMVPFTLKNPSAKEIKVVATDSFGHQFTCDTFTKVNDWSDQH